MKLYYILLLILSYNVGQSQTSQISGKIISENNEAISYVSVSIKQQKKSVTADERGNFVITGLTPGTNTLYFSSLGYASQQKTVELQENDTVTLTITLREVINTLQTVEITGRKEKSYKNSKSFIGAKKEIALKDLPQAVSYATKELIADQG